MSARAEWMKIQEVLGTKRDGIPGPKDEAAITKLKTAALNECTKAVPGWTAHGIASSFADPADVRAFDKCKKQGKSDNECFKVGDNGQGCWGDSTKQGSGPSCAVPPDDMEAKWGSVAKAKHKKIIVHANGKQIEVTLKDRMPWKKNITNGAVIDLNPDAAAAVGLKPPFMVEAKWKWAT